MNPADEIGLIIGLAMLVVVVWVGLAALLDWIDRRATNEKDERDE